MDVHNNPLEVKSRMRMGDTVLSMGPDGDVMVSCMICFASLYGCFSPALIPSVILIGDVHGM